MTSASKFLRVMSHGVGREGFGGEAASGAGDGAPPTIQANPQAIGSDSMSSPPAGRRGDGLQQRLGYLAARGRDSPGIRHRPRGPGRLGPPHARRYVRLCRGRRRARPEGHHRRRRRRRPPAGHAGRQDHGAGARRAGGRAGTCRASIRCTASCRCPRAFRSPPSPSAAPARPTRPCSRWPCWPTATPALRTQARRLPGPPDRRRARCRPS